MSKSKSTSKVSKTSKLSNVSKPDMYQEVTDRIIEALEQGVIPWHKSWHQIDLGRPQNAVSHRPYGGINVLLLWMNTEIRGYGCNSWLTFKQVTEIGGKVIKGEKSTPIIFFRKYEKEEIDEQGEETKKSMTCLKKFSLFNVSQCENLPEHFLPDLSAIPEVNSVERIERADSIVSATGIPIHHKVQNRAFYQAVTDEIMMPEQRQFPDTASYYSTLLHEIVHATGHKKRLDRQIELLSKQDAKKYAFEELVAEIGSAFLCAELGIVGENLQHESYIAGWLEALKNDKKYIFKAASQAQKAFEYLMYLEQKAPAPVSAVSAVLPPAVIVESAHHSSLEQMMARVPELWRVPLSEQYA